VVAARAAQPPAPTLASPPPAPAPHSARPEDATTDAEEERVKREVARLAAEKAKPRAPAKRERRDDEPRPRAAAATAPPAAEIDEIPAIVLHSVRWHPLAPRRVVSLDLPQMGPLELHEGDIAGGVLVRRIDPGSIEVQVGSARKRISLEP
jgi:hypothetical protein